MGRTVTLPAELSVAGDKLTHAEGQVFESS
jgi:hypothetical protein